MSLTETKDKPREMALWVWTGGILRFSDFYIASWFQVLCVSHLLEAAAAAVSVSGGTSSLPADVSHTPENSTANKL